MKAQYIKPNIGIHDVPELMCTCGCGSYCSGDCQCHNGYHGHNPHGCNCGDGTGHGFHPDNEQEVSVMQYQKYSAW